MVIRILFKNGKYQEIACVRYENNYKASFRLYNDLEVVAEFNLNNIAGWMIV